MPTKKRVEMTEEMKQRFLEENAHLLNGLSMTEQVCVLLDQFQKYYEKHTLGDVMPGNKYYQDILMGIVNQARYALERDHQTCPFCKREFNIKRKVHPPKSWAPEL